MSIGNSLDQTPFSATPAVLDPQNPSAKFSSGEGYSLTAILAKMAPRLPGVAMFGGLGGGSAPPPPLTTVFPSTPRPVASVGMTQAQAEFPWTLVAAGVGAVAVAGLVVFKLKKKKR